MAAGRPAGPSQWQRAAGALSNRQRGGEPPGRQEGELWAAKGLCEDGEEEGMTVAQTSSHLRLLLLADPPEKAGGGKAGGGISVLTSLKHTFLRKESRQPGPRA